MHGFVKTVIIGAVVLVGVNWWAWTVIGDAS
jgi:hypothetical protein